jgi:aminobutyraldehyde dehydrogenase
MQTQLLINHQLLTGEGPAQPVFNPARGGVLVEINEASEAQVDAAVSSIKYGCTWVNTHVMLVSEMPHGGQKLSGYGKDMSRYGLADYTVVRHVMFKH